MPRESEKAAGSILVSEIIDISMILVHGYQISTGNLNFYQNIFGFGKDSLLFRLSEAGCIKLLTNFKLPKMQFTCR
jgi:hypothetical protein